MSERNRDAEPIPPEQELMTDGVAALPPIETEGTEAVPPPELSTPAVPDELTGRASKTEDDLESLFGNETVEHLDDGFKGGSGDEPGLEAEI
jgi:hypothetical protein